MPTQTGANEARPRRGFRPIRVLFVSWLVLSSVFLLLATLCWPVRYTATAKFTRHLDPAALQAKGTSFETGKVTLFHDLAGEPAIEQAANHLGLPARHNMPRSADGTLTDKGKAQMLDLVRAIQKNLVITWEARTDQVDLIAVSFTDSNAELAEELPNRVVKNYIDWASAQIVSQLKGSERFLSDQVEKCRRQYETVVAERIAFESNCAGFIPATPGALDEMVRKMESDRDVLRRQNTLAKQKLARWYGLEKELTAATYPASASAGEPASQPAGPSTDLGQEMWAPNPKIARLAERILRAEDALDEMVYLKGLPPTDPALKALQNYIDHLTRSMEKEANERPLVLSEIVYHTGGPTTVPSRVDLSVEIAAAESEVEMTRNELERLEARLSDNYALVLHYTPVRLGYEQLVRKCTERQEELKQWEAQYMAVKMALEAEASGRRTHLESVQAASRPTTPNRPSLALMLAGSVLLSLPLSGIHTLAALRWNKSRRMTITYWVLVWVLIGIAVWLLSSGRLSL